jgi:hypothetical protein
MRISDTKALKGIIYGLLIIAILSIACAGAGNGNSAVPAGEGVQSKVAVDTVSSSDIASSSSYAGDYFPKFEKIRVDPAYKSLELKPGDSKNFTVTVENKDNKTIELKPKPVITPYTENFINESWISISPSKGSLKPGEKEEFQVEVNIPKDADLGNYAMLLAFTEKVPEGDVAGSYPNFPGTMQLNIQVWVKPSVQILTPYVNDLVEAGKSYTYEIKLRNTGSKDISISPELTESMIYSTGMSQQAFGDDAIRVEAPDKIKAGQTAIVNLSLAVPATAKGSYSGSLDMNIDDPGIREYEGMISLSFRILPVPEKPYENTFEAETDGPITLEIRANQYGYGLYTTGGNRNLQPSFNVSLTDPSGNKVTPTPVDTKYSGSITIVDDTYPPQPLYSLPYMSSRAAGDVKTGNMETKNQGSYQGGTTTFIKTYTAPGAAGKWKLSIFPENTENFDYTVTIGAAEK